ncbi:hypothetical protein SAMN06265365_118125 [Tistlia consotensis]|uniref:Uncharacterized protein n=1 Tax=Tistlia consotensis USBA 355 TaxID=560819 RepID=A0A1Y6CI99_9PROT|nr:hypothetical protein [Tistlia consotensis]SMF54496.1 hypothetical protein SAMN05428998_119126 [Tistlia consotensis USBA 355]SNR87007.1 hypothetical protein SAMN06265365_118125 [Tistlia consotensis]
MDPQKKPSAVATNDIYFRFVGGIAASSVPQIEWGLGELRSRLGELPVRLLPFAEMRGDSRSETVLNFALGPSREIDWISQLAVVELPEAPESFAIFPGAGQTPDLYVYGSDVRGLIYAITELADRARFGGAVPSGLHFSPPLVNRPTAKVRSISRCFQSVVEDLSWFHDRAGWEEYLTLLVTHRFNRISLTLGMQYNYPYGNEFITDVYFYLAYPFLVSVPGAGVEVSNLTDGERDRNLETLKFIAREAERRGLEFQLALWTQSYDFDDCPNANHQITGLESGNLARYCRDALALILAEVPEISGLTLRVHVECGIPEGSYDFWETYFEAVKTAGRTIRLDLHAKGIDETLIDTALATGMPVGISPKYTSEHLGLPYHQASIRPLEQPENHQAVFYSGRDAEKHAGKWQFSEGSRKFMRYSYGDLLRQDRPYDVVYRIWPGTMRILLWGDAALAGGYGRNATFCGSQGVELCEPLSFKGRMGTGLPGNRIGYRAEAWSEPHDWQKFAYTYRVWGRSLYDPEADPQAFRRYLDRQFGEVAGHCERALASASRILPLITLAHTPTASNNSYWPEMYQNMSVVREAPALPYGYELLKPARFGTVGACDPQLFMSPSEFAQAVHLGDAVRKLSPLTWANWLDRLATAAALEIARAEPLVRDPDADFRRLSVDVAILAAVGRFFAEKVRAAVLWELYLLSDEARAADGAIEHYRRARDAWARAAQACQAVYVPDITYGPHSWLRGRWDDRLPAIDQDILDMAELIEANRTVRSHDSALGRCQVELIGSWSASQRQACRHLPPEGFRPGTDLELSCAPVDAPRRTVFLHYRHVNQSEPWHCVDMLWTSDGYTARIPGEYTRSPFPLQYYFEIDGQPCSTFFPGLADDLSNVPYFVLLSDDTSRAELGIPSEINEEKAQ